MHTLRHPGHPASALQLVQVALSTQHPPLRDDCILIQACAMHHCMSSRGGCVHAGVPDHSRGMRPAVRPGHAAKYAYASGCSVAFRKQLRSRLTCSSVAFSIVPSTAATCVSTGGPERLKSSSANPQPQALTCVWCCCSACNSAGDRCSCCGGLSFRLSACRGSPCSPITYTPLLRIVAICECQSMPIGVNIM